MTQPVGHYSYEQKDRNFLQERIAEFESQVKRRLSGSLSEEEFKPLRLMNGLYLQVHAYMLRVAIPYGVLDSRQLRSLAYIARHYDRGYGHFTTRQNIQFNWISLKDAPEILRELAKVDMHAIQTSGNCIRNVTSDEYAGAARDELMDPRIHAEILRQWSTLHPEFTFLPRKFKIAISGSPEDRVAARFHDIGLLAHPGENGPVFRVFVGGGLGRTPVVGQEIFGNVPEAELLATLEAILRVYNSFGRRDNIYRARIKILVQTIGIDAFRDAVKTELAKMDIEQYRLTPEKVMSIRARFAAPSLEGTDDVSAILLENERKDSSFARWVRSNTHPHYDDRYCIAAVSLKAPGDIPGDITADQMDGFADLADRFSFGEIRITHLQNMVLGHVRKDQLYALWEGLKALNIGTPNLGLVGDIVSCPGLDYCTLANARSLPLARKLSSRFGSAELQEKIGALNINISGCINACGHHHAGHIGILGVDKRGSEFYQILVGGQAGESASIGSILGASLTEDETVDAITRMIDYYLLHRVANENFSEAVSRLGKASFKEVAYDVA